jgi:hypothetical protein
MSKLKVSGNASGTGVITLEAPNTNTDRAITLPDSAGTLLMTDGDGSNLTGLSHTPEGTAVLSTGETGATKFLREDGDGTCSWQAAGGGNSPYFAVHKTYPSRQTLSSATWTKITLNELEVDSDSAYDSATNYRFTVPSGEGGDYFVTSGIKVRTTSSSVNLRDTTVTIRKNGSAYADSNSGLESPLVFQLAVSVNTVVSLSAGDYIEAWVLTDCTSTAQVHKAFFNGFKIG